MRAYAYHVVLRAPRVVYMRAHTHQIPRRPAAGRDVLYTLPHIHHHMPSGACTGVLWSTHTRRPRPAGGVPYVRISACVIPYMHHLMPSGACTWCMWYEHIARSYCSMCVCTARTHPVHAQGSMLRRVCGPVRHVVHVLRSARSVSVPYTHPRGVRTWVPPHVGTTQGVLCRRGIRSAPSSVPLEEHGGASRRPRATWCFPCFLSTKHIVQ